MSVECVCVGGGGCRGFRHSLLNIITDLLFVLVFKDFHKGFFNVL